MDNHIKSLRALLVITVLTFSTCLAGGASVGRRFDPEKSYRGMAFLSSDLGSDVSPDEICEFVRTTRINLVVIDFAWITYHWPRTTVAAVDVVQKLSEAGVDVAVMYRPRALDRADAAIHYAVNEDGTLPGDHNDLCFAHEDSVTWGAEWGVRLLKAFPTVNKVILYNLRAPCCCEKCRDGQGPRHAARFLQRCRSEWKKVRPDVQIGHVGIGTEYADEVDFLCPFLSVNREDDSPLDVPGALRELAVLKRGAENKPVIPLLKTCWELSTNNTTEDVSRVIQGCEQTKAGYILWYYGWLFHSREKRYDPKTLLTAMGGDWQRMSRYFSPATGRPDAQATASKNEQAAKQEPSAGNRVYSEQQIRERNADSFFERLGDTEPGYHQFAALQALDEKYKRSDAAIREQIVRRAMEVLGERSRSPFQRWQCCYVLSGTGDERGIPVLARVLLEDSNELVRDVAACALGQYTAEAARKALEQAAKQERNEQVKASIKKALAGEYRKKDTTTPSAGAGATAVPELAFPHPETRVEKLPWPHQPPGLDNDAIAKLNREVWVINDFPLYQADETGTWRYFHGGFDIVLENGARIYAMKDGWVKAIHHSSIFIADTKGDAPSYGWEYTHLGNFQVKVGDFVKRGTRIGEVNFSGLPHIHLAKVFSQAPHWGLWHYLCPPNAHFTYQDDDPPVIKKPFYFFRNNSDRMIEPDAAGRVTVSGRVDIVVGMRDAGRYARSSESGFGDRLGVARIDYAISPASSPQGPKHQFHSFDFTKLRIKSGYDAKEYSTRLARVVYKHWTLFETSRPHGSQTLSYYTVTNCTGQEPPVELKAEDENCCWNTAALTKERNRIFSDGDYEIAVTAHDFAGNKSTEVMRVTVANGDRE
jgi:murein DD-endopeptidase MepM/ murein hydrolase activator NlpD